MIEEKNNINIISKKIKKIVDFILIILLILLSIKKGGFYKTDSLEFNLIITFIGTVYIIYFYIINVLKKYIRKRKDKVDNENNKSYKIQKNKKGKFDVIEILLLLLCFSYLLPIVFNNYSNLSDSIFEMIRYFNIYLIYVIVKKSDNKQLYINIFIFIAFVQCLLGIDGLANRYLLPLLNKINSGYLTSDNLARMSSTIQYANVFSLICILANIYVIDKLKNKSKITFQNLIEFFFIFVFTSSIILSESRIILAILIYYLTYILVSGNSSNKFFIGLSILLSIIYTTILMKLLLLNTNFTYLFTFSIYMFAIIIYVLFYENYDLMYKAKSYICQKVPNKKVIYIVIFFFTIIYMFLAISIKVPIKLNSNVNQNYVLRNIYNLDNVSENEISIKIEKNDEDSRYRIDIYEVNNNFESTLVQTYNYYDTITDTFKINYLPKEDFENLMVKITCQKNSIQILEILVNNKNNYIDYLFLPSDVVYRIRDTLSGDLSFKGRVYFIKDSISLINLNIKNFFFGLGGEGFKNTYETIKSSNYFSTEVHNVYLQIFVESGVIGFVIFVFLVTFIIKNYKLNNIKMLLYIFLVTSFFDLNFSYMFTMVIFTILLALLNEKDELKSEMIKNKIIKNEKNFNIFEFIKVAIVGLYGIGLVIVLTKSNVAYYMRLPKLNENNMSFEEISNSISKHEKRVYLDTYDTSYRYSLHLEYKKYLKLVELYIKNMKEKNSSFYTKENGIDTELLQVEYKNIVGKMEENLLQMQKNDKYNSKVLIEVTNSFIEYIELIVDEKYTLDKEAGYNYYLNIIIENIEHINNLKYNNEAYEMANTLYEYCYNKLNMMVLSKDSKVINEYISILNEKLK